MTTVDATPADANTAQAILAAIGGADNVVELEPCITRLRIRLVEPDRVDDDALVALGAMGVRRTGHEVQVVYGPDADAIAAEIADLLPAAASQPGGLYPIAADGESEVVSMILGDQTEAD